MGIEAAAYIAGAIAAVTPTYKVGEIAAPDTNAGFLAHYNQIPASDRHQIEVRVWSELNRIQPSVLIINNFGLHYIQNLTRATYSRLPRRLQERIEYNLWIASRFPVEPNWGPIFMLRNLP